MATNPYDWNWPRFVAEQTIRASDALPKTDEAGDAIEQGIRAAIATIVTHLRMESLDKDGMRIGLGNLARHDCDVDKAIQAEIDARIGMCVRLLGLLSVEPDECGWSQRIWDVKP